MRLSGHAEDANGAARLKNPSRPPILAPFQVRSFRFQWPADLATSWATEMEVIILGWYVVVETESVLLLTLFGSLQLLGTLCAPMFGVVGDRIGHRNLLCLMRAVYGLLAATLMTLALTGTLQPVHVFIIGTLAGLVRSSDLVMRNALIGATIPTAQLVGAMSISRTTADSARIAGALAGAGLVAALGMGLAYAVVSGLYAAALLLTLGIAGTGPSAYTVSDMSGLPKRSSPWHDLREGLTYVWNSPHLLAAMYLAFLVNLAAYPFSNGLLPYIAKEIYAVDQTGLGYLTASFAVGALTGSIALTTRGAGIRPARMMIIFASLWFAVLLVFVHVEHESGGIVLMACAGLAQSLSLVPLSVMLLRSSEPRFRGRVLGVRMLAVYGLPVGLLATGPLIERIGFATTGTIYASFGLVATLAIGLYWRRHIWSPTAPANMP